MPKACRPTLLFATLLGLTACSAAAPPPAVRQACWEGPAPSCLPPTSDAQAAAQAAAAQPSGPFENSSHAYVNNPK